MAKGRTMYRGWRILALPMVSFALVGGCGGGSTPQQPRPDAPNDTTPPKLVSSNPEDGARDVAVMLDSIELTFDEVLDLYRLDEVPRSVQADGRDVEVWLEPADGGKTLKLHPFRQLPSLATVTVEVGPGLADLAGNRMAQPVRISFRTGLDQLVAEPPRIAGPPGYSQTPTLLRAVNPAWPLPGTEASWSSDDESVATVADDGTVTLVAPGTTTVRARLGGQQATLEVVVAEAASGGLPPGQDPSFMTCNEMDLGDDGRLGDGGCDRFDGHWAFLVEGVAYQPPRTDPADPSSPRRAPQLLGPYEGPVPVLVGNHLGAPGRCVLLSHGEASAAQTVDLSSVTSARLTFSARARTSGPDPDGTPTGWQLLLRDAAGMETTLVDEPMAAFASQSNSYDVDLSPWAGGPVELVWRLSGAPRSELEIVTPSVLDDAGGEHFADADCASLDAWHFPRVLLPRRIRYPEAEVDGHPGIFFWRELYVPYQEPFWVRYLDVVENRSSDIVTLDLALAYDVGPIDPAWVPLHDGEVVLEEDGEGDDPGVALLIGGGYTANFEHDEDSGTIHWDVSLEPGQRVWLLTYNVYLYDEAHPDRADLERVERLYSSLQAGVGPAMAGLDYETWNQPLNWHIPTP